MNKYRVKIDPEALSDIQNITSWYNEARIGLGTRFQNTVIRQINSLNRNPGPPSNQHNLTSKARALPLPISRRVYAAMLSGKEPWLRGHY